MNPLWWRWRCGRMWKAAHTSELIPRWARGESVKSGGGEIIFSIAISSLARMTACPHVLIVLYYRHQTTGVSPTRLDSFTSEAVSLSNIFPKLHPLIPSRRETERNVRVILGFKYRLSVYAPTSAPRTVPKIMLWCYFRALAPCFAN